MSKSWSFKYFKSLLVLAVLVLSCPLYGAKKFSRSSEPFDKDCSVEILESIVEVYPPGNPCPSEPLSQALPEFWCVRHCIHLANGLLATNTMLYDNASYHKLNTRYECSGRVNVALSDPQKTNFVFSLIFEDNGFLQVDLWASDFEKPIDLPSVVSLEQLIKTIPHWFYDEHKLEYVIGLSDGTFWITPQQDSVWVAPWPFRSCIVKIGTNRQPLLLNLNAVSRDDPYISLEHCLKVQKRNNI